MHSMTGKHTSREKNSLVVDRAASFIHTRPCEVIAHKSDLGKRRSRPRDGTIAASLSPLKIAHLCQAGNRASRYEVFPISLHRPLPLVSLVDHSTICVGNSMIPIASRATEMQSSYQSTMAWPRRRRTNSNAIGIGCVWT